MTLPSSLSTRTRLASRLKTVSTLSWLASRTPSPRSAGTSAGTMSILMYVVGTPGSVYRGSIIDPSEEYVSLGNLNPCCDGFTRMFLSPNLFRIRLNSFKPITDLGAPVSAQKPIGLGRPFTDDILTSAMSIIFLHLLGGFFLLNLRDLWR